MANDIWRTLGTCLRWGLILPLLLAWVVVTVLSIGLGSIGHGFRLAADRLQVAIEFAREVGR